MFGSLCRKAMMSHMSSSLWLGQADIPDILMPFLMIQNSSPGAHCLTAFVKVGGEGYMPLAISPGSTPGAEWHEEQCSAKCEVPPTTLLWSPKLAGGSILAARTLMERTRAVSMIS